ncbi:MAG TPA: hypothetical protein DEG69_09060 [Flavobacteriaceae bacterium]|nr:hypothetical protein [Flavobacteriaceae bacterium]|tara:strand:- start:796 stop:993 length:198 start_codon:yes stop_codon:yes gene_type:complete
MIDYTKYTLEGAGAFLIIIIAYKIYRMRCNTSSKCCKESFEFDLHNDGTQSEIIIQPPRGVSNTS